MARADGGLPTWAGGDDADLDMTAGAVITLTLLGPATPLGSRAGA
ncbi:hypothetical protein ABT247_21135 [Kitasatospora sp. NPDC001539]